MFHNVTTTGQDMERSGMRCPAAHMKARNILDYRQVKKLAQSRGSNSGGERMGAAREGGEGENCAGTVPGAG